MANLLLLAFLLRALPTDGYGMSGIKPYMFKVAHQETDTCSDKIPQIHSATCGPSGGGETTLVFCHTGKINATVIIPLSSLKDDNGPATNRKPPIGSAPWYIDHHCLWGGDSASWGQVSTTSDRGWPGSSYGYYLSKKYKTLFPSLTVHNDQITLQVKWNNDNEGDIRPNAPGTNCTLFKLCAYISARDPCYRLALCKIDQQRFQQVEKSSPTATHAAGNPGIISAPGKTAQNSVIVVGSLTSTSFFQTEAEPVPGGHNSFYHMMTLLAKQLDVNGSCYMCATMPHSLSQTAFLQPQPYTQADVHCMLAGIAAANKTGPQKLSTGGKDPLFANWAKTNTSGLTDCTTWNNVTIRLNISTKAMVALHNPIFQVPLRWLPSHFPICFQRKNHRTDNIQVGVTKGCNQTLNATCGWMWSITTCLSGEPTKNNWQKNNCVLA